MNDDEIELAILQRYVSQHKVGEINDGELRDKCARELNMREVIKEITKSDRAELNYLTKHWFTRLVSQGPTLGMSKAPLVSCSDTRLNNSTHQYNARAFTRPHSSNPYDSNLSHSSAPAWDRINELEAKIRERESFVPAGQISEKIEKVIGRLQEARGKLNELIVREYFEFLKYQAKKAPPKLDHLKIDIIAEKPDQLIYAQVKLGQISSIQIRKVVKSISALPAIANKAKIVAIVADRFPNNAEVLRYELEQEYSLPIWHIHTYQILDALPQYKRAIQRLGN